ncbi:MAG: flagellar basal-body rod protein FlgC [Thermotogota bacterium]|nr:flagellar basal-body rod protein FlgC [Thermotogota bacterium]MDK2864750.1 flagellar basal-body rod protein FlgC [Thermotogota bacterium]HCZ07490.1 flagellar basal body rod protein FlgC [Thermotogota bacterium]
MLSEFKIMSISATGLTAQRLRIDVIATNIANAETTRTETGEPYRRKIPVFSEYLVKARGRLESRGVKVVALKEDPTPFRLVYDPGHPDADEKGYVRMPNVNVLREMVDLISAQRAYEANVSSINAVKSMVGAALEIGRG